MPTYTYYCEDCDEITEKMMKIADRDHAHCDQCSSALKRKLDRPGMVWSPTRNSGYSL